MQKVTHSLTLCIQCSGSELQKWRWVSGWWREVAQGGNRQAAPGDGCPLFPVLSVDYNSAGRYPWGTG